LFVTLVAVTIRRGSRLPRSEGDVRRTFLQLSVRFDAAPEDSYGDLSFPASVPDLSEIQEKEVILLSNGGFFQYCSLGPVLSLIKEVIELEMLERLDQPLLKPGGFGLVILSETSFK